MVDSGSIYQIGVESGCSDIFWLYYIRPITVAKGIQRMFQRSISRWSPCDATKITGILSQKHLPGQNTHPQNIWFEIWANHGLTTCFHVVGVPPKNIKKTSSWDPKKGSSTSTGHHQHAHQREHVGQPALPQRTRTGTRRRDAEGPNNNTWWQAVGWSSLPEKCNKNVQNATKKKRVESLHVRKKEWQKILNRVTKSSKDGNLGVIF